MNRVELSGQVCQQPRMRELPSGSVIWNVELSCPRPGDAHTGVPVVVPDGLMPDVVEIGDRLHVTGYVARRFFRAGGVTQTRTEVHAESCSHEEER